MSLLLDDLHCALDQHFRNLANSRSSSGLPLFALEHGLSISQIEDLSLLLRARLASGERLGNCWLLWVVYAAEIGYGYTGEEYWHSFEEQTPGWELHHRDLLRDWYRKFQAIYRGVVPSGAWAKNFPIIAWPITHAILPKYLQYQFARAIYQNRYRLVSLGALDPPTMGRLLAASADDPSTRFRQFLQQEELTGRILLGLLGAFAGDSSGPINSPTLLRIVNDLDAVRTTQAWLRDVRTVVANFKGIGQGSGVSNNRAESEARIRRAQDFSHIDIRPRIFLRHSGRGSWAVGLIIPNLASVAAINAEVGSILRAARSKIAGSTDVKPAGWVLSPGRLAIVKSWPAGGTPLIKFEESHAVLDGLLKTDFAMSSESCWLFRIGLDGIARELASRTVRPDTDYILLTTGEIPSFDELSTSCTIDCSGITGCRLSIPSVITADHVRLLAKVGLQVARTIRVWPSGLPCRGWDGEGQSEWLTTEEPCLGIVHDHPVSSFLVRLNGVTQAVITEPVPGVPNFIRLDCLPTGIHRLTVVAHRHGSIADIAHKEATDGFLDLFVREPEPWIPGVSAHSGLIVRSDPHDADLEDLWANKVDISVLGPESHQISCGLTLERPNGDEIISGQIATNVALPLTAEGFRKKLEAFININSWWFPEASVGRVHIKAGELGEYVLQYHRDIQPLRLLMRRVGSRVILKLADDTGSSEPAYCESFGMNSPTTKIVCDAIRMQGEGMYLEPPGALYVARNAKYSDALVVSYGLTQGGLQGLGVKPNIDDIAKRRQSLSEVLLALDLWSSARIAGPFADFRRDQVTNELKKAIFALICGEQWVIAERNFLNSPKPKTGPTLEALQYKVCSLGGFGAVIKRDYAKFLGADAFEWYAGLSHRFAVCNDPVLCQFAIRLAFDARRMLQIYGPRLDELNQQASANQKVVRGARFGALLCAEFAPLQVTQFEQEHTWV